MILTLPIKNTIDAHPDADRYLLARGNHSCGRLRHTCSFSVGEFVVVPDTIVLLLPDVDVVLRRA